MHKPRFFRKNRDKQARAAIGTSSIRRVFGRPLPVILAMIRGGARRGKPNGESRRVDILDYCPSVISKA
jgi:hypothetical protein